MSVEDGMNDTKKPVIIVGGGLAGLATAAYLAKAGRPVTILERGKGLGGRADTHVSKGYFFNLGPHALYAKGAGRGGPCSTSLGSRFRGMRRRRTVFLPCGAGSVTCCPRVPEVSSVPRFSPGGISSRS